MFAKVRTCQPKSRAWNWRPAGWSSLHIHLRGTWWASHSDIQTLLPYLNKKARVKLCSFCCWNVPPFPYNHKFPFPYAPFLLDPRGLCEVGVKWTLPSPSLQTQSQAITIHCQNNFEEYKHEKMIPAPCHTTLSWSDTSHPREITRTRWYIDTLYHVRNQLTRQLTQSASRQQVRHQLTPTYAYQGFTYAHHSYDHLPSCHIIGGL